MEGGISSTTQYIWGNNGLAAIITGDTMIVPIYDSDGEGVGFFVEKTEEYTPAITSGRALPSLGELFNVCAYFNMTPADFFAPLAAEDTSLAKLNKRLQAWSDEDIAKVIAFVDMIEK